MLHFKLCLPTRQHVFTFVNVCMCPCVFVWMHHVWFVPTQKVFPELGPTGATSVGDSGGKITPRHWINLRRVRRVEGSVWERRLLQLFAWNRSESGSLVSTRHMLPYVCTFIYFRTDAVFVEAPGFAICMQNKFLLTFHLCIPSDNVWASKLALSFCYVFFIRNFSYKSNMNLLYI